MIARVFPRRTKATPVDRYAFIGEPPFCELLPNDISEVHVSVTFTWDLPEAERLAIAWERIAPTKIGGPATGMRGEEFVPGRYLKPGYVITSRGCNNRCWFCSVHKREGNIRELPITEGHNLLDDNILSCNTQHILDVFAMLKKQSRVEFTGGLEAKKLKPWHVEAIKEIRPKQMFFAYDTPDDLEPLEEAMRLFRKVSYGTRNNLRCYVLLGYPGDTTANAEKRLETVKQMGMCPMAMLYRDHINGKKTLEWRKLQQVWARPSKIYKKQRKGK